MHADLHTHSAASSDSTFRLQDRVSLAAEVGVDVVGVTDHTAVSPRLSAPISAAGDCVLIAGVELNCTVDGDRIDILGLFIEPEVMRDRVGSETHGSGITVDDGPDLTPSQLIGWIHEAGGVAVLAHPGRYRLDLVALLEELVAVGLDGIETDYAYDMAPVTGPHTPEAKIRELADRFELLSSGGSDCHGPGYNDGPYMGADGVAKPAVAALCERTTSTDAARDTPVVP